MWTNNVKTAQCNFASFPSSKKVLGHCYLQASLGTMTRNGRYRTKQDHTNTWDLPLQFPFLKAERAAWGESCFLQSPSVPTIAIMKGWHACLLKQNTSVCRDIDEYDKEESNMKQSKPDPRERTEWTESLTIWVLYMNQEWKWRYCELAVFTQQVSVFSHCRASSTSNMYAP